MADGAMLARTPLMATGSWASLGKQSTCAPILSDWLDKAEVNAVHVECLITEAGRRAHGKPIMIRRDSMRSVAGNGAVIYSA